MPDVLFCATRYPAGAVTQSNEEGSDSSSGISVLRARSMGVQSGDRRGGAAGLGYFLIIMLSLKSSPLTARCPRMCCVLEDNKECKVGWLLI